MTNSEQFRHECEVRDCIKRFYPRGDAMAAHLQLIEKRRGKEAATRLRVDVRKAWEAERQQQRKAA